MSRGDKLDHRWMRPTLPPVVAKINEDCPKGFRFERQVLRGGTGAILKAAERQYGAGNAVVLPGHWMIPKTTHRFGGLKDPPVLIPDGCRVYIREPPPKPKRPTIIADGRQVEAWEPDYSRKCECGGGPVVPQTGKCALCQWGDSKIDESYK